MKILIQAKRALELVLAIPFAVIFSILYFLIKWTIKVEPIQNGKTIPTQTIVFFSHSQIYAMALSPYTKKHGVLSVYVLGYHGFLPYVWAIFDRIVGIRYFLFDPHSKIQPFSQIAEFFKKNPDKRLALATDSGGPYGKVKKSLLNLALETQRSLVGIGASFSKEIKIFSHRLPVPGARLRFRVLLPIPIEELKGMPEADALDRLQKALHQLIN